MNNEVLLDVAKNEQGEFDYADAVDCLMGWTEGWIASGAPPEAVKTALFEALARELAIDLGKIGAMREVALLQVAYIDHMCEFDREPGTFALSALN